MARPSNNPLRRAQIGAALIRVMAVRGYAGASITAIAEEAGLAPGLVHYHFDTKLSILVTTVEMMIERFEQRYRERLAEAGDEPRAQIDAFIDAHLALGPDADESTVAAWVVIGAEAVREPQVRDVYARSVEHRVQELERLVRAANRASGRSSRGAKRIAAAVLSAIEGAYQLSAAAPGVMPRGYAAPAVRAMVDGLL